MFMRPFSVDKSLRTHLLRPLAAAGTSRAAPADPVWTMACAWMNGASLRQLFGDLVFDLLEGVGEGRSNRRADVAKLQALLHREGDLDLFASGGPTGYWTPREEVALRAFQQRHGLEADGIADPEGQTIAVLRGLYAPKH
ncbi:peptidoglycan-binding domain-containing protein [Ferrovibrio sp.]|uniref:peptidoglycan-binding domain-containing protein n=1 Tax=Ferrovibrio sp. TaxID=1917215 RepID=UPI002604C230|nr:peptidoglycan-binding domain-containing protein [Ferrovibrio sp.]